MARGTPDRRTITIYCSTCRTKLYKYKKGGTGGLVKCFIERIAEDYTDQTGVCPSCETAVARPFEITGKPALKIISGKVYTRGMRRK